MFKVLLVVYVLGGGHGGSYAYNTNFVFQEFNSVADCEAVIEKMEDLADNWHRGKKENVVPHHYSAECVTMTSSGRAPGYSALPPLESAIDDPPLIKPTEPIKTRKHQRWDRD